jgi:hypothetical protein
MIINRQEDVTPAVLMAMSKGNGRLREVIASLVAGKATHDAHNEVLFSDAIGFSTMICLRPCPEVRGLAVSPGVVDTAFVSGRSADFNDKVAASTPLKRIGDAEDIAAAITACITMLGYSTGHIVQVDGGRAL